MVLKIKRLDHLSRSRAQLNESFIAQICVRFSRARLSETRVVVGLLRRISRLRSGWRWREDEMRNGSFICARFLRPSDSGSTSAHRQRASSQIGNRLGTESLRKIRQPSPRRTDPSGSSHDSARGKRHLGIRFLLCEACPQTTKKSRYSQ